MSKLIQAKNILKALEAIFLFAIEQRLVYQRHVNTIRALDHSVKDKTDIEITEQALVTYTEIKKYGLDDKQLVNLLRKKAEGGSEPTSETIPLSKGDGGYKPGILACELPRMAVIAAGKLLELEAPTQSGIAWLDLIGLDHEGKPYIAERREFPPHYITAETTYPEMRRDMLRLFDGAIALGFVQIYDHQSAIFQSNIYNLVENLRVT